MAAQFYFYAFNLSVTVGIFLGEWETNRRPDGDYTLHFLVIFLPSPFESREFCPFGVFHDCHFSQGTGPTVLQNLPQYECFPVIRFSPGIWGREISEVVLGPPPGMVPGGT